MNERDDKKFETGQDTDMSKSQSGQQPASSQDDTSANQTGKFQQPTSGSDQQIDSAGETTTLGQQGTDIEGEAEMGSQQDGGFVGSEGQQDTSSELVDDEQNIDKDGQSPRSGQ
jgi:hypothetical protein